MKRILIALLAAAMLCGCSLQPPQQEIIEEEEGTFVPDIQVPLPEVSSADQPGQGQSGKAIDRAAVADVLQERFSKELAEQMGATCETTYSEGGDGSCIYFLSVTIPGISAILSANAEGYGITSEESWETIKTSVHEIDTALRTLVDNLGDKKAHISVVLVNDLDPNEIFYSTFNGVADA